MVMPLFIALLLGLSALLIVIQPLLGLNRTAPAAPAALSPEAVSDAAERERLAKQALRDVDFDYRLGNLDEGDYSSLRERYERRALAALKTRYDREQELDAHIDRQLAALRAQEPKKHAQTPGTKPQVAQSDDEKRGKNGQGVGGSVNGKTGGGAQTSRQGGSQVRRRKGV